MEIKVWCDEGHENLLDVEPGGEFLDGSTIYCAPCGDFVSGYLKRLGGDDDSAHDKVPPGKVEPTPAFLIGDESFVLRVQKDPLVHEDWQGTERDALFSDLVRVFEQRPELFAAVCEALDKPAPDQLFVADLCEVVSKYTGCEVSLS